MMSARRAVAAALCMAAGLSAPAAWAHPHMFVDAQSKFLVDDSGALTGLRTAMLIDELTTLFVLEENGVGPTETRLTKTQQDAISAGVVDGLGHYDHFTDLKIDGARQRFTAVKVVHLGFDETRLAVALELTLETPQPLYGRTVELALYDPTYYAAVDTLAAPVMPPSLIGCRAELVEFEPSNLDAATLVMLGALSREETPEEPRIGARFADRSTIACAP